MRDKHDKGTIQATAWAWELFDERLRELQKELSDKTLIKEEKLKLNIRINNLLRYQGNTNFDKGLICTRLFRTAVFRILDEISNENVEISDAK